MASKLKALEKNLLKYRAFQMVLLLHEMESLKRFIIGSIRGTDKIMGPITGSPKELPEETKKPLKRALEILVGKGIITTEEGLDIQEINEIRNTIGHEIHALVIDLSDPEMGRLLEHEYDYSALERLDQYKAKIHKGVRKQYIMPLSLREAAFEEAEKAYKEELRRLRRKIVRQHSLRYKINA